LGRVVPAKLSVSDRNGYLAASAETVGVTSMVGWVITSREIEFSLAVGHRWLRLTGVTLVPKEGFPPGPGGSPTAAGTLPEELDFGGFFVRARIGYVNR
jgi:hypothetical protein